MRTMEEAELKKGVAEFYDESSWVMEGIWGGHLHYGIYFVDGLSHQEKKAFASLPRASQIRTVQAAQIRTIDETLRFAAVSDDRSRRPKQIVDVGCGIGGSSTYLAKKYGATCHGITLSPIQAQRAQAHAAAQGLADKVFFQVADALEQPFPDGQFDLIWSLESGEHVHDKRKDIKAAYWSEYATSFWPAVIHTLLSWKAIALVIRAGWKAIKGALAVRLLIEGHKKGLMKFAIITCRKPG